MVTSSRVFLYSKVAIQLNSDDLKNVKQALLIFLSFFQPIKHFYPNPKLGRLLPKYISRIEVAKGKCALRR